MVAAAAVLALGACESDSGSSGKASSAKPSGGSTGSVVAPGKPGEPARTLSADEARKALPDDSPNDADISYAHRMIEHHQQALTMTDLVPGRAGTDRVKRLAERISAAQKPEIGAMEGWLSSHGQKPAKGGDGHGGHDGHGGGAMPGMATDAQLTQLREARGASFDKLFLKLMITHHQGAITMATEALTDGNNVRVEEMANDVVASQTVEINRMRSFGKI
ncbi:lipoprotein [Streptomyces clavuligerus]|nr:lipoprotein [Streptomyces clavuligerus]